MQALVMRMIASVGSTIDGSGTSSTRTSPAAYMSVARMVLAPGLEVVRLRQTTLDARAAIGAGDQPGLRHGVDGRPAHDVEGGAASPSQPARRSARSPPPCSRAKGSVGLWIGRSMATHGIVTPSGIVTTDRSRSWKPNAR